MSNVVQLARFRATEPYLTKRQIGEHYGFGVRWVERRVGEGMPSHFMGGQRRFRLSEVEPWIRGRYADQAG